MLLSQPLVVLPQRRRLSTPRDLRLSLSNCRLKILLQLLPWIRLLKPFRSVNLCEQLITAFRVQEITDRELFVALDTSEESLRDTCKEAFGIDPSKGFAHKRELGKVIEVWKNAKVHSETKLKIDAVARSHGEPVSMLSSDWESLMTTFKSKYGANIHDTLLPSQSYFEGFEERLASGQLRAETLAQIVSVREQEEQEAKKPDMQRHMSLHLDGQLTIQSKRRFLYAMPQV